MAQAKSKEQLVEDFRIQTIQEAAARVIGRDGLERATMRAIAKEAGIAKGTIYLYFEDRTDLVQRTADHALSQLLAEIESVVEVERPFPEQLLRLISLLLEYFEKNRDFFRLYLAVRYPSGEVEDESRHHRTGLPQYQAYIGQLSQLLEHGMDSGHVRRTDALRLALFISEGINAILLRRLQEGDAASTEADAAWIVETILNGISIAEDSP